MTNTSKTVIFFGSGPVAADSLELLANNFDVEAVVTKPIPPHHKGTAPTEELAKKLGITTYFAANQHELDDLIDKTGFKSKIGIVVDFGVIISQKVINSFDLGIVNSHFSLLPQWRGADPITFSILSGQPKTGVSLMVIDPTLDTGKLITYKSIAIDPSDTTQTLTKKLIDLSNQLLLAYLPEYMNGNIKPKNQPHPDRATYSRKLTKADAVIDWSKPAEQLEREVRAFAGWPGSKTNINNIDIKVTKSHVSNTAESKLSIPCGDGNYLSIDELIAPSGRKVQSKDFINGYLAN
ncbi:hypothetical protein HGB25_01150 [Candidatus Saccharibacteria bacterium]|nr:hypothetical protein [Candidatus Saccharibacteria bacterium]